MKSGFTLVELLITIGILGVLLAIVLVAINPARQFAAANNTRRKSDIKALLDAIGQYSSENGGRLPASITTSVKTISDTGANICNALVPTYLPALPVDPATNGGTPITNCAGPYQTNYQIVINANGRLVVSAPGAEQGATISVTR